MFHLLKRHQGLVVLFVFILFAYLGSGLEATQKRKAKASKKVKDGYVIERRRDGSVVKYKKKNVYDFEGYNVDGLYNKPSGSYISNIKDVKARTIIRIRKHFDDEIIDSGRMIK